MVQSGEFRNDLLFRLRSITIELPPLRERPEDIKELALHYMAKLCENFCEGTKGFSPEFLDALKAYHWPGNVRELVSTLERAIVSAGDEPTLFPVHLPIHMRVELKRASVDDREAKADVQGTHSPGNFPEFRSFREQGIATLERQYMQDLMSFTNGNIEDACRLSDLSRSRLYGLMKKHKVSRAE
jgi:two-component system NtrC family response regulator